MKQLNGYKMRVVFVGIVAVNVLGGGIARGDFTFGEPVNLGPNVNSAMNDGGLTISSDGLSLFFESNRSGNNWDIWQCTRETIEDEWGPAKNLGPTVNSPQAEGRPSISADGLELFFCSLYWMAVRPGGFGGADLWVTRRTSVSHPWSTPENLGSLVNSAWHESEPYISADGLELYFSSDRPGGKVILTYISQHDQLRMMHGMHQSISDRWSMVQGTRRSHAYQLMAWHFSLRVPVGPMGMVITTYT